ncbi:aldo/keto reductase [Oenococcus oeni]|uniref:Aldo/keto reductase, diketogulonate reductase n=56 Tax=Oenococcus oeni TaxID=1247 RepID=A0NI35_OENOE|nr:aldo/keto reductase [Oenococcus oeni]EAV39839.1 aldo/keto reductase, diketogulonate reductase [Oenococcus oeni ATCC BAA-1163]KDE87258.1 2,5-diketo-D-gluconic acid reductase [Oenococcus oeni]KEP88315.1 2,5-diketo-D-gluconic acid reductase [Oenococcus oeni IOEB_0501]KGH66621.1 2,5-diketo-D-gluconic acid reductase [Oenococcus oeni IOEB_C23]KMQ37538.1 2,5-diketo-D-gluconic acid reductase [Oenococcus oeni]
MVLSRSVPNIVLNDGHSLPAIGLGTYLVRGGQGVDQILSAIEDGYRLIDTSTNYDSEGAVGEAIRRSGIPRSEFIVTSKLPGKYHHYQDAMMMIQESIFRMGIDYLDLYLIHWPLPKRDHYVEAWKALVDAQKLGLIRSIGVSNFLPEHLDRIINESGVTPAVNQIEVHPYWVQEDMLAANKSRGIVSEAWSPLGRGSAALKEDIIKNLADKYGKNTGQIILRWHTQRGIIPLPKSSSLIHQRSNIDIFDFSLTSSEIEQINALNRSDGRVDGQDPNTYEEFD